MSFLTSGLLSAEPCDVFGIRERLSLQQTRLLVVVLPLGPVVERLELGVAVTELSDSGDGLDVTVRPVVPLDGVSDSFGISVVWDVEFPLESSAAVVVFVVKVFPAPLVVEAAVVERIALLVVKPVGRNGLVVVAESCAPQRQRLNTARKKRVLPNSFIASPSLAGILVQRQQAENSHAVGRGP